MSTASSSDLFLIDEIKNGNERALKELFNKYYTDLVQYGTFYVPSSDVEEIVQDLFVFIWENCQTLVISSTLKGYLISSVKNKALNHIRSQKTYESKCLALYEKYRDMVYLEPNYMLWELRDELQKCINNMPEAQRETFKLSRFTPLTNKEIAEKLNVSEKTVEYRLSQALKFLKERMSPTYFLLFMIEFF